MTGLSGSHCYQPSHKGRRDGVNEQKYVRNQKRHRADEVKTLIDPAVVIVAMIIPSLYAQRLQKLFHLLSFVQN
jgi:hypothetical protein